MAVGKVQGPATAVAGETEVPARQTSPGTSFVPSSLSSSSLSLFLVYKEIHSEK